MLIKDCIVQLKELGKVLMQMTPQQYAAPLASLSGNTIGKHTRHTLNFFQLLIEGNESGTVDYDKRLRGTAIESELAAALDAIDEIETALENIAFKKLTLTCTLSSEPLKLETNTARELLYLHEHTVHHLAIIRIGIEQDLPDILMGEGFGIAKSTLTYLKNQS